jgi:hypothetical protein
VHNDQDAKKVNAQQELNKPRFFVVWNPSRHSPRVKHDSYLSAREEAERLSVLQPNESFIVLVSCCEIVSTTTVKTRQFAHI